MTYDHDTNIHTTPIVIIKDYFHIYDNTGECELDETNTSTINFFTKP